MIEDTEWAIYVGTQSSVPETQEKLGESGHP